jgi:hypothetical protein
MTLLALPMGWTPNLEAVVTVLYQAGPRDRLSLGEIVDRAGIAACTALGRDTAGRCLRLLRAGGWVAAVRRGKRAQLPRREGHRAWLYWLTDSGRLSARCHFDLAGAGVAAALPARDGVGS